MSQTDLPPAVAAIAPDGNLTPRQKRQLLIRIALKRVQPGTGSSHEFMRRRTAMHALIFLGRQERQRPGDDET